MKDENFEYLLIKDSSDENFEDLLIKDSSWSMHGNNIHALLIKIL